LPTSESSLNELTNEIEAFLGKQAQDDVLSGAVLIALDNRPILRNAYGLASIEFQVPNQVDIKFNIGSLNKLFTKVGVAQLAEQGRLSFDDYMAKYLPDYPPAVADKVKIQHLLDHTSGMGHYWNERFEATKDKLRTVDDFVKLFRDDPLMFEPGTRNQYSNNGYVILGKIIEVISGQDYYEYVREHIYRPARMDNSDHYERDIPVWNLANGYTRIGSAGGQSNLKSKQRRNNVLMIGLKGSPAGGGYSTVEDLLKFMVALKEGRLVSPDYEMVLGGSRSPRKERPKKIIRARGGAPGVAALIQIHADTGLTVIILSNYDPEDVRAVSTGIEDIISKLY